MRCDRLPESPFPLRLGAFLLTLSLLWLPVAAFLSILIKDANTLTILAMGLLFVEFILLLQVWERRIYRQPRLLQRYGLIGTRQNGWELLQGLGVGIISLFSLFLLQGGLGWIVWQSPSPHLGCFMVEGGLVGLGVGLAEELLFRGWLLDELEQDYSPARSLWINSLTFACLHFLKPWQEIVQTFPQFLGLVLLGLALVWAKRSCQGRLGLSIGLHSGLVWGFYIINVGQWVRYTHQVPAWITGINQNPLAGIVGLVFLCGLALYLWGRSQRISPV